MYDANKYPDAWYRQQVVSTLGLINEQDIEDAMQEARIAVWQGKRVKWVLIDWMRIKTKYKRDAADGSRDLLDTSFRFGIEEGDESWQHPKTEIGEDGIIALLDVNQRMARCGLTKMQARALLLYVNEDLTAQEVATRLGCTRANVWYLLIRARKKLRKGG